MALKSANQPIRWWKRIGTWIVGIFFFVSEVLKSFFGVKAEDGFLTRGVKAADLIVRQVAYFAVDYGLWIVSVGIFVSMKALGFSFLWIFAAIWAYEFVAAGTFVVFYEKTGKDLSLGADFRRAIDTIHNRSRLAAYLAMVPIIIRAIVWTGPEKIITFFRKEIGTIPRIIATLLVLTAIQALLWTILYELGYGLVME